MVEFILSTNCVIELPLLCHAVTDIQHADIQKFQIHGKPQL